MRAIKVRPQGSKMVAMVIIALAIQKDIVRATLQSAAERAEGEWNESGVASEANTTRG